jgi:hypothetical protein
MILDTLFANSNTEEKTYVDAAWSFLGFCLFRLSTFIIKQVAYLYL